MRANAVITAGTIVAGLVWLSSSSCHQGPTGPSDTGMALWRTGITRLQIEGPRVVAPGDRVRFTAIATLLDVSTRDVSAEAAWLSTRSSVLSVGPGGAATAIQAGDTHLSVQVGVTIATMEVIVVPKGTYRLVGRVSEAGTASAPVAAARIEVAGGPSAGLSTETDEDGRYGLYGVAGETQLRVTRPGYAPLVRNLVVADHQVLDLDLALLRPREDFSGRYALTLAAAETCRPQLPAEAWIRHYAAELVQNVAELDVKLAGATFVLNGQSKGGGFRGRIEADYLVFQLDEYQTRGSYSYYYRQYPHVVEQIGASTYLVAAGTAVLTGSPQRLDGTLNGVVEIYRSDLRLPSWPQPPAASCRSEAHRLTLSR
jgi:hypothetical protein